MNFWTNFKDMGNLLICWKSNSSPNQRRVFLYLPLSGVSLGYILIKIEISFVFRGESFGTQVLGQRARRSGNQIRFKGNKKKFSFPKRPDYLRPTSSFQSNSRGALHWGESGRRVELTNELCQIPRIRMRGVKFVDPHMLQCLKENWSSLVNLIVYVRQIVNDEWQRMHKNSTVFF